MEAARKRCNKRQKVHMVEKLHANFMTVRGNTADAAYIRLFASLTEELNRLGCRRSVEEWINVWGNWVQRTKMKARLLSRELNATGGGPAAQARLTEWDEKILFIVGSAAVDGFISAEVGTTPPIQLSQPSPPAEVAPGPSTAPPTNPPPEAQSVERSRPSQQRGGQRPLLRGRLRSSRPRPRPHINDNLVRSLNENSKLLRETISEGCRQVSAAVSSLAQANIVAAQIIAGAISGNPIEVLEDAQSSS